ncbi:hypothetical protein D3C87_2090400 [compost metagenome]
MRTVRQAMKAQIVRLTMPQAISPLLIGRLQGFQIQQREVSEAMSASVDIDDVS